MYACHHRVFDEMDVDKDGSITLSEFTTALMLHRSKISARAKEIQTAEAFRFRFLTAVSVASVLTAVAVAYISRRRK